MPVHQRHQGKNKKTSGDSRRNKESDQEKKSSCPLLLDKNNGEGDTDENQSKGDKDRIIEDDISDTAIGPSFAVTKRSRFDIFLLKCSSIAYDATNHERGLKLLQYICWFFARVTKNRENLSPKYSDGFSQMYNHLSMTRYAMRIYGIPTSLEAIRTGSWWAGWKDPNIHLQGKIMAWSMLFYYPLEHVAYLKWVAPKSINADAEKYTALSCRFWFLYVLSDFTSSFLKLRELKNRKKEAENPEYGEELAREKEVKDKIASIVKAMKLTKIQIIRCLLFCFPAAHWSLPDWERKPWLKDGVLNGLMLSEALVCFYQSICSLES